MNDSSKRGALILEKKIKTIALISIFIFIILMMPMLYLSSVNRATGDDYGYSAYTKAAWASTHSLAALGEAACKTVQDYYHSWQGTWFSVFVFSMQPEVFHDNAYVIVAFLMLFLWIGSTFYLFRQILCERIGMYKWSYRLITVCFLIICIEFIPSTKSSIFWFNGCAHYMLPFAMCQMLAAWLIKYGEGYQKKYFVGIFLFMTLLGGSNYQAALFAFIVACYTGLAVLCLQKDKRILILLLPVCTELLGLIVSMKAPGNLVRAAGEHASGEGFGFSAGKALATIGKSFLYALKDIGLYWEEKPLVFAGLLFLFLCFLIVFYTGDFYGENFSAKHRIFRFPYSLGSIFLLFCLYSAMQAPAIYADVEVSGGVPNMDFQVFMLMACGILLIVAEKAAGMLKGKQGKNADKRDNHKAMLGIVAAGLLFSAVIAFWGKGSMKDSASYVSLMYIVSGQAADYKEQMDLQTELMQQENVADVVVPFINNEQGPLMHMPITDDKTKFTNYVTAQFYGKSSVVAMERPKWMELYGN